MSVKQPSTHLTQKHKVTVTLFNLSHSSPPLVPFSSSCQSIHGETEKRQPQLQAVVDLAEALKAVLRGNGGLVDDKVSLLRCNWIAVTSRAEEWLNLLLVRERSRIQSTT